MMRFHFLNSFNLGAGYDDADYVDGRITRPTRKLPRELGMDYKNGGCLVALRSCDDYAYLLVKKILFVNKQKTLLQQGRTVNINFSIEVSPEELPKLCNICAGMLAEWNNFCHRLGDIIEIPGAEMNDYGYSIEQKQLYKLFDYLELRGQNAKLPDKIANALTRHSSPGILLVVTSDDVQYYIDNFKSIDSSKENSSILLKHWDCVIPASRNQEAPKSFEKLTSRSLTKDYDQFLANASVVESDKKEIYMEVADGEMDAGDTFDRAEVIDTHAIDVSVDTMEKIVPLPTDGADESDMTGAQKKGYPLVALLSVGVLGIILGYVIAIIIN